MTSLKDLINSESDDDQVLPPPFARHHSLAKRPSHLETVLSPSSHASPTSNSPLLTTSFTPFNARTTHSRPPPNSSSVSESWQASSSGGNDTERRPSNTSLDSSEPPYAGLPSSSTMAPVKLTPVTKRVSKARKGVPVHTCDECSKTFTRAEHLRRHKLSHRPPGLACPVDGCEKTFYRKDLLDRHQLKHENASPPSQKSGHQSPSQSYHNAPLKSGLQMPRDFGGTGDGAGPSHSTSNASLWKQSTATPSSSQTQISSPEPADSGEDCPLTDMENNYTTTSLLGSGEEPYTPGYSQPRQALPTLIPDEAGFFQGSSGIPSPGSESAYSAYSTPAALTPEYQMSTTTNIYPEALMQPTSFHAPSAEFQAPILGSSTYPQPHAVSSPLMFADGLVDPLMGFDGHGLYNHLHNMPTQMVMVSSPGTLLSIPPALPQSQPMDGFACGRQMIHMFNTPITPTLTNSVRETIPHYIEVYWEKVNPHIPIIHRSTLPNTFEPSDDLDALRCAMAAVATQHLDSEQDRITGDQLHAYATHKCKAQPKKPAMGRSLPIEQAQLLCDFYARFRGKRNDSYRASQRFGSLYERAKMTVFRTRISAQRWKEWVRFESTRRLLAACFLLDVHCSHYHKEPHTKISGLDYSYIGTLRIPLSTSTAKAWEAENESDWIAVHSSQGPQVLNDLDWKSLKPSDISSMSPFDASIILAASSLRLPNPPTQVQLGMATDTETIHPICLHMAQLFSNSAVANTYLALHYTPLRSLLSVSGNSWVFNKKITDKNRYAAQQEEISRWGDSRKAAIATVFATRALVLFLHLTRGQERQGTRVIWSDLSDYWGVYVCALICWAFGNRGQQYRTVKSETRSHDEAAEWILEAAEMDPGDVHDWDRRHEAHGVVGITHKALDGDCLGGRNILFRDAVRVLQDLGQKD